MRRLLLIKTLFACLFFSFNVNAQIPDSCTFVQKDSIITIEMESTNLNGTFWVKQTEIPGYSGSGYVRYIGGDATGLPGNNVLTYTFQVKEAGRHSFKMRAYREAYHDNDVWVRFPHGGVVAQRGTDSMGTHGNNWFKAMIGAQGQWYGFVKTQLLGTIHGEDLFDLYVDFPAPGIYTVEFSARATGFRIDKFMMYYKKSSFFGMNGSESPKKDCQPYNMDGKLYVANPLADQSVNAGSAYNFTIPSNTFGNGTSIGYSAYLSGYNPLPAWLNFNPATGTFSGTPTYQDGGRYTILVRAQDNGTQSIDEFILTVIGNNPPVMSTPLKDSVALTDELFVYDISGNYTDPDGHPLTYTVSSHEGSNLPSWLSFNGTTFTGTPTTADVGRDTIYITVADNNGGSTTGGFIIHVKSSVIQSTKKGFSKMNANLYPNPVEDVVNVKMNTNGMGAVSVTDNMGRVYYSDENVDLNNDVQLNLNSLGLQPGLYILKVRSEQNALEYNALFLKK